MSGYVKPLRQPMYRQLQERLREVIESGEFAEGEQFLTERQVVERYHVSRPTANKVLSGMAAEGRLEFRKGVGMPHKQKARRRFSKSSARLPPPKKRNLPLYLLDRDGDCISCGNAAHHDLQRDGIACRSAGGTRDVDLVDADKLR